MKRDHIIIYDFSRTNVYTSTQSTLVHGRIHTR